MDGADAGGLWAEPHAVQPPLFTLGLVYAAAQTEDSIVWHKATKPKCWAKAQVSLSERSPSSACHAGALGISVSPLGTISVITY